jgi:hypothetical protein
VWGGSGLGFRHAGGVCGFGLGEVRAFFFCSTVALGIGVPCCMLGRIICVRWCCGLMLVFFADGFLDWGGWRWSAWLFSLGARVCELNGW